jgi:hypothetical protein
VKKTLALAVICLAVIAISVSALAADVTTSKDGRMTIATKATKTSTPYVRHDAGETAIFDNLAVKYPKGTYWCCEGATIFGPKVVLGGTTEPEYWEAGAFTPTAAATVTSVEVAVGFVNYESGETNTVTVGLYDDNSGVPGKLLAKWTGKSLPTFGTCCTVVAKSDLSVSVSANTQYWVAITTTKSSSIWAAWNVNDSDQVDAGKVAFWCSSSSGQCGSDNNKWTAGDDTPDLAFAVFGK